MARAWLEPTDHPQPVESWGMTIDLLRNARGDDVGESYGGSLAQLLRLALSDERVQEIFVWSDEQREFLLCTRERAARLASSSTPEV